MIHPSEYLAIKQRVLLTADVADLVVRTPDKVRFDEEQYQRVWTALTSNRADVSALLAELDVLRAAAGAELFPLGSVTNASDEPADSGGVVEPVPPPTHERSGSEVRDDNAGHGGPLPAGGLDGERPQRPKSRRNSKRSKASPQAVDAGSQAEQVGGSQG